MNNLNNEILLQDASLNFLEFIQAYSPSIKVSKIRYSGQANQAHPSRERIRINQPIRSETAPSHLHKSTDAHHTLLAQPSAGAPLNMVSDVLEYYPDIQLAIQL